MRFYCANIEIYDNFDEYNNYLYSNYKTLVTEKLTNKKPNNQYRQIYGMTAFKFWLSTEQRAIELCEMARSGIIGVNDLITFYKDFIPLERAA
jgi:hypothetical protein